MMKIMNNKGTLLSDKVREKILKGLSKENDNNAHVMKIMSNKNNLLLYRVRMGILKRVHENT